MGCMGVMRQWGRRNNVNAREWGTPRRDERSVPIKQGERPKHGVRRRRNVKDDEAPSRTAVTVLNLYPFAVGEHLLVAPRQVRQIQ